MNPESSLHMWCIFPLKHPASSQKPFSLMMVELLSFFLCLPPLLTHKSSCFQEHFGRYIPKMLLCFASAAAVRGKNDIPCGKQTAEFHLANRKDGAFDLPQEKLPVLI